MAKLDADKRFRKFRKYVNEETYEAGLEQLRGMFEEQRALVSKNEHVRERIYPVIALAKGLERNGWTREQAMDKASAIFLDSRVYPSVRVFRRILRLPGIWRLVIPLAEKLVPGSYNEDQGFDIEYLAADRENFRFNVRACPYWKYCSEYGLPELTEVFCSSDDISYGEMHPCLLFARSQTLGRGGALCDFDFHVKKAGE